MALSRRDLLKLGAAACSRSLARRLRLRDPVRHAHLAIHRSRRRDVLPRPLVRARALVELAETEMAVGDDRAHPEPLGERKCVTVVAFGVLGPLATGGGVGEKP